MHDFHLLGFFVIVTAVALGVAWLFDQARLPPIVGFLAAGVILGPGATEVVSEPDAISLLAEIGVVLLLFSIGLELSFRELRNMVGLVFGAGGLQLTLTTAAVGALAYAAGLGWRAAVFAGMLASLSSTAIVLTELYGTDELMTGHGRSMTGVLIFQDLAVVPLILVVPFLAGAGSDAGKILGTLATAAGVVAGVWAAATWVFPLLAEQIVKTRRRELFTLFSVVVVLGTAYVSGAAGLSLALGAFLAGLVISESPHSDQMVAQLDPFKDVFNSLFFVSMGLLFEPAFVAAQPGLVLGVAATVVVVKALVAASVVFVMGYGFRVALLAGLGLAQVGEFSFILAQAASETPLLSEPHYQLFIVVAVLSMSVTPFCLRWSGSIAERLDDWFGDSHLSGLEAAMGPDHLEAGESLEDHVVLIGFGEVGRNVARAMRHLEADYVVADLDPETVRRFVDGEPIYYGDASRQSMLKRLGVADARAIMVTTGDRISVRRVTAAVHEFDASVHLVARTRFVDDVHRLYRAGADQVVVDEFETSLELVEEALRVHGVPPGRILREKDEMRRHAYGLMREQVPLPDDPQARHVLQRLASSYGTEFVQLPQGAAVAGQTIEEIDLRGRIGATVVAIVRDGRLEEYPEPAFVFSEGDRVLVIGESEAIAEAVALLRDVEGDGSV